MFNRQIQTRIRPVVFGNAVEYSVSDRPRDIFHPLENAAVADLLRHELSSAGFTASPVIVGPGSAMGTMDRIAQVIEAQSIVLGRPFTATRALAYAACYLWMTDPDCVMLAMPAESAIHTIRAMRSGKADGVQAIEYQTDTLDPQMTWACPAGPVICKPISLLRHLLKADPELYTEATTKVLGAALIDGRIHPQTFDVFGKPVCGALVRASGKEQPPRSVTPAAALAALVSKRSLQLSALAA